MTAPLCRDGLPLAVHRAGSGPLALVQHGLGGDAGQVAALWPDSLPVTRLTLDCRGHGGSPKGQGGWSFAQFAADLEALLAREACPWARRWRCGWRWRIRGGCAG